MTDRYLTIPEVAELLKVHPRTVRRWIKAGKLKATALPGRGSVGVEYRISEADLQAFLDARQAKGGDQ